MPAKGTVSADAALSNQFKLEITGLPAIVFTRVGDISSELVTTTMADQTVQTTGQVKPAEFEVDHYVHHTAERVAMEAWFLACASGATGHKLPGFLYLLGADGSTIKATYMLDGVICKGRKLPEHDAMGDGEGVRLTWTCSVDSVLPL